MSKHKIVFFGLAILVLGFFGCADNNQNSDSEDVDITVNMVGRYEGSFMVTYTSFPDRNIASVITATITRLSNSRVAVNMQGGDTFEADLNGSAQFPSFIEVLNPQGVFEGAQSIQGGYDSGSNGVSFTITGTYAQGGSYTATYTGNGL